MAIKKVLAEEITKSNYFPVVCANDGHSDSTMYDDPTDFALSDVTVKRPKFGNGP
jgi:hypothetical protein